MKRFVCNEKKTLHFSVKIHVISLQLFLTLNDEGKHLANNEEYKESRKVHYSEKKRE